MRGVIWDLGDTLITRPPGGQDLRPLATYAEVRLRPSAAAVLAQVAAAGLGQAVLSNTAATTSADARQLLLKLGVLEWFDVVVATASELDPGRLGKPDARVFRQVLSEWGLTPDEAVMVGNTWEHDIVGANGAGLAAIFLTNPAVSVRGDAAVRLPCPPWVIPAWDLPEVPLALNLLTRMHGAGRFTPIRDS